MTSTTGRTKAEVLTVATLVGFLLVLSAGRGSADQQTRLQEKLRGLQDHINAWIAAGGDPAVVIPLGQRLDQLLKAGRPAEAEAQVDRILAVVSQTPAPRQAPVTNKLNGLQEQINEWLAAGGDPSAVLPLGQKLDELLGKGTPEEVDAQIDRIRAVIARKPSPAVTPGNLAGPVSIDAQPIPASAALIFWSTRYDPARQGPTLGPSELYTMSADGGNVTQITFGHAQAYEHAAVSFSHTMIAADRYLRSGTGPTGLWVIDIQAKTDTRLVSGFFSAGNGGVDWSPAGFIYFAALPTTQRKEGIFRIRPDGSGLTEVVSLDPADPGFLGDVSVAEDGSMLAYVRAISVASGFHHVLKTQIWVARIDGSAQRMVDDGGPDLGNYGGFPIGDFDPEISPDDKFVVFSRTNPHFVNFKDSVNTAHDLWIASVDGSVPARRLTDPGPVSIIPDWDDNEILYTEYDERGGYIGLAVVAPDGSGKHRLEGQLQKLWDGGRHGKWIPHSSSGAP